MNEANISTLEQVRQWLAGQAVGQELTVSANQFDATLVNHLFTLLAVDALTFTINALSTEDPVVTVSGTGTLLQLNGSTLVLKFSETDGKLVLELDFELSADTRWQLVPAWHLTFTALRGQVTANTALGVMGMTFASTLEVGQDAALQLPISMQVPSYAGDWELSAAFDDLGSLTDQAITALAGDNQVLGVLSAELSELDYLKLQGLQIKFNPLQQTCAYIKFNLAYQKPNGWKIFSDQFTFDGVLLNFEVFNPFNGQRPKAFQAQLEADMTIAGVPLAVGGLFTQQGGQSIYMQLRPQQTLHLTQVLEHFHTPLPSGFPDINIAVLSCVFYLPQNDLSFTIAIEDPIALTHQLSLDSFLFELQTNHDPQTGQLDTGGLLSTTFAIGPTQLVLSGNYQSNGVSTIYGEITDLPIGHLITDLLNKFNIPASDIPQFIHDLTIQKATVLYQTDKTFEFYLQASTEFGHNELDLFVNLTLSLVDDQYQIHFDGTVMFEGHEVGIDFDRSQQDNALAAHWSSDEHTIGLTTIARALGITPPNIPEDLDLGLRRIAFSYSQSSHTCTLEADSKNYGKASFAGLKNEATNNQWAFYFGMATDRVLDLSNLPIIGKALPASATLAIDALAVNVASIALTETLATTINQQINQYSPGYPNVPNKGMSNYVAFSMVVDIGGDQTTIALGADQAPAVAAVLNQSDATTWVPRTTAAVDDSKVLWFNIQKNLGPLYFDKIGLTYQDSRIFVLVNVSATAGGLTLTLDGFGVGMKLDSFDPEFTIQGIGITFAQGPVVISGMLLGSFDPVNLTGEIFIKVEDFAIGGIGGYTEVQDEPSMFLYAVLDAPLGGTSYFFVEGLSAGFGFNRKLVLPDIAEVNTFPFVEWVIGSGAPTPNPSGNLAEQINEVVENLVTRGTVAPQLGANWLAAGLKFTSFGVVDSFALLTLIFGAETEVAVLGLSRMTVPPGAVDTGEPIVAEAELALKAAFSFNSGELSIQGQLTNNSFILSPDCRLTGGFAFCTWLKGEHLGDFVISLGGYNQDFKVPAYYPAVPRLGINWVIPEGITIKGNEYYTLTSNAVMAGGLLQAVWKKGDLKAWFTVQADFLMILRPFHYDLKASVDIGASFRVNLLFTHKTITVHVGVGLHIWGPKFSGTATVHLSVISFTIAFGHAAKNKTTRIPWSDFVTQLLPTSSDNSANHTTAQLAAAASPEVVKIVAADGLISQLSEVEGELNWVVNPEQFALLTNTVIPAKDFTLSDNIQAAAVDDDPNTDFGVRPVGVASADFNSTHQVTITSDESSQFLATHNLSNVPKGLWQKINFNADGTPIISDPLNHTTIDGVLTGFMIKPQVTPPDHTLPIDINNLRYTVDPNIQHFTWGSPWVPDNDPFRAQTVADTIMSETAQNNRSQLFAAMQGLHLNLNTDIDVSELSSAEANDLLAEPILRLLGEEKQEAKA